MPRSPLKFPTSQILACVVFLISSLMGIHVQADPGDLQEEIENPSPAFDEGFGWSLSGVNDWYIVGAPWDNGTVPVSGKAYVIEGASGEIIHTLENPTPGNGDGFGYSVGGGTSYWVVGAPEDSDESGVVDAGAIYLFDRGSGGLLRSIANPTPARRDRFAEALAVGSDLIVVGAREDDTAGGNAGAVYVFDGDRTSPGFGTLLLTLLNPDPRLYRGFGRSLVIKDNLILVGSDSTGGPGSVHVYDGDISNPTFGDSILVLDHPLPIANLKFGRSIGYHEGLILVSATRFVQEDQVEGVVYAFDGDLISPSFGDLVETLTTTSPSPGDDFGISISSVGDHILIGSSEDSIAGSLAGAAYLYDGDVSSPSFGEALRPIYNPSPAENDSFGRVVAGQTHHFIVAAPGNNSGAAYSGSVFLFDGEAPPSGTPTETPTPSNTFPPIPTPTFTITPTPTPITQGENTTLLAAIGGSVEALAVDGDYSFIGEGSNFVVFDTSNKSNPIGVARRIQPSPLTAIAVAEGRAYVGDSGGGFTIYDVTDPTDPILLSESTHLRLGHTTNIQIVGSVAYVSSRSAGFHTLDVSDPSDPVSFSIYLSLDEEGDSNSVDDAQVIGQLAYIAASGRGLDIVDISDPSEPTRVSFLGSVRPAGAIHVQEPIAYVGAGDTFYCVDVSSSTDPAELGSVEVSASNIWDLVVDATQAYVGVGDGYRIVEVENPAAPVEVVSVTGLVGVNSLRYVEGLMYVVGRESGFHILDLESPQSPSILGQHVVPTRAHSVAYSSNLLGVGGGVGGFSRTFYLYEISDPAIPQVLSDYRTSHPIEGLAITETHAYLGGKGVEILDISDPVNPVSIEHFDGLGLIRRIKIVGDRVYALAWQGGLSIIDIQDPGSPQLLLERHAGQGRGWFDVEVKGDYAYLSKSGSFEVFNISDPTQPLSIASMVIGDPPINPGTLRGMFITGDRAFVAGGWTNGLLEFDISNPMQPNLVQDLPVFGRGEDVTLDKGLAYVSSEAEGGLQIHNLTGDSGFAKVGSFSRVINSNRAGATVSAAVKDDIVYVADTVGGLLVIQHESCISSATLVTSCVGGLSPSEDELRLNFHRSALEVEDCSATTPIGENLILEVVVDADTFQSASMPSCVEAVQDLEVAFLSAVEDQARGIVGWRKVTDGTLLLESAQQLHLSLCGEELGVPCGEGMGLPITEACNAVNLFDGIKGNERMEDFVSGLGIEFIADNCPAPAATPTPTPTATLEPTATSTQTPTLTGTPTPIPTFAETVNPYDLEPDGKINEQDLLKMLLHVERRPENKSDPIIRFSTNWGQEDDN